MDDKDKIKENNMPATTTYRCDKCGGESNKSTFLWRITVDTKPAAYNSYPHSTPTGYERNVGSEEWCEDCCVAKGLVRPRKVDEVVDLPPVPTLEDMIREIAMSVIPSQ